MIAVHEKLFWMGIAMGDCQIVNLGKDDQGSLSAGWLGCDIINPNIDYSSWWMFLHSFSAKDLYQEESNSD